MTAKCRIVTQTVIGAFGKAETLLSYFMFKNIKTLSINKWEVDLKSSEQHLNFWFIILIDMQFFQKEYLYILNIFYSKQNSYQGNVIGGKSTGVRFQLFLQFCDLCPVNPSLGLLVSLFVPIYKMKWLNHGDYSYSKSCILGPHRVTSLIAIVS